MTTSLFSAIEESNWASAKALIEDGILDSNDRDLNGCTTYLHLILTKFAAPDDLESERLSVFKALIQSNPQSLLLQDALGNTPIHTALLCDAPASVLELLLDDSNVELLKECAKMKNINGELAIHMLVKKIGINDNNNLMFKSDHPYEVLTHNL